MDPQVGRWWCTRFIAVRRGRSCVRRLCTCVRRGRSYVRRGRTCVWRTCVRRLRTCVRRLRTCVRRLRTCVRRGRTCVRRLRTCVRRTCVRRTCVRCTCARRIYVWRGRSDSVWCIRRCWALSWRIFAGVAVRLRTCTTCTWYTCTWDAAGKPTIDDSGWLWHDTASTGDGRLQHWRDTAGISTGDDRLQCKRVRRQ